MEEQQTNPLFSKTETKDGPTGKDSESSGSNLVIESSMKGAAEEIKYDNADTSEDTVKSAVDENNKTVDIDGKNQEDIPQNPKVSNEGQANVNPTEGLQELPSELLSTIEPKKALIEQISDPSGTNLESHMADEKKEIKYDSVDTANNTKSGVGVVNKIVEVDGVKQKNMKETEDVLNEEGDTLKPTEVRGNQPSDNLLSMTGPEAAVTDKGSDTTRNNMLNVESHTEGTVKVLGDDIVDKENVRTNSGLDVSKIDDGPKEKHITDNAEVLNEEGDTMNSPAGTDMVNKDGSTTEPNATKQCEAVSEDVIQNGNTQRISVESSKEQFDMDTPLPQITGVVSKPQEVTTAAGDGRSPRDAENAEKVTNAEETKHRSPEIVKVLTGLCTFPELPSLPKKVVRIFVSSTFTDTKEERNALMQHVYPKLSDNCREKHGLDFQIVDMRWGVPEQASDNHTTSELCIQEIKKCQEVSVGPNFMAIVGDKYGYRPIPRSVEEGLFQSLAAAQVEGWDVVEDWYKRDDNAVPAVFILQPISSKIEHYYNTENADLRNKAWEEWNAQNQQMCRSLRTAADRAFEGNKITGTERQIFYMSVTENEITSGVLEGRQTPSESCYCIIRKISDIDVQLNEVKAPRFIDADQDKTRDKEAKSLLDDLTDNKLKGNVPDSNLTVLDIEWSVSGACMSLEKCQDVSVLKYAQKFFKEKKMGLLRHKEYLDDLCHEVFIKLQKLIQEGTDKQMELFDDLTTEILQHYHLAKMRCNVFEGREEILGEIKSYLNEKDTTSPFIVYGKSGCGKTSVMAKVFESVSNKVYTFDSECCFTVVARFLGTSTKTSNVHQLLVSMCTQLSIIFETQWQEPEQFTELVKSFYKLLENATPARPILLILDSVDQLMPIYNAYKLYWLPDEFPANVKLIASTIDEGFSILDAFREKYESSGLKTAEVCPLGESLGLEVIMRWLEKDGRHVTDSQRSIVQQVLTKCSLPLYARIVYDNVRKWMSFDVPTVEQLETTVKGAINKLFQQMEEKFGKHPVQHSLAYLTNSRNGLSEAELEHILSLDDLLLNKIFKLWNPPVRRIPPLIWTRIRADINSYIVERSADGQLVLYWYHRQFIMTTKERYLSDNAFSSHINDTLIDFFSGKWGNGKEKPFLYTDSQMKRFGFEKAESKADRKVPSQPYWIDNTRLGNHETRYNKRKLSELPFHLLRKKDFDQLKQNIFFSFDWLIAKMKSSSVQQMIEEVDIFMRADKVLKKDPEMKLLYANLQLIRPYITMYPESLSFELSGRLAKYVGKYIHLTNLIRECDSRGKNHFPLVPLTTCFETASLGFQQNLNFRSKEPWHQGGTFTCSPDFKTLFVLDYNEDGLPTISSWDVASGEKVHGVLIDKVKSDELKFTTDLYFQAECIKDGKELLGFYKRRMDATYQKTIKPGSGFIDVIDLETGKVKNTYDTFLYRDEFFNPLFYMTDNYMSVANGWKMPLINFTENIHSSYNRPTLMSSDEKFFIMCGKDKTVMRLFDSKEVVAEFETPEHQIALTASDDFAVIAMMGAETKDISVFDLSNKVDKLNNKSVQFLKSRVVFSLDDRTSESVASVFKPLVETLPDGRSQEKTNNRVIMKISPDKRHLMAVFIGWKWVAFLWKTVGKFSTRYVGKYSAKFVGPITPYQMSCTNRYPVFNHDSSALVYTSMKRKIVVVSSDTVEVTNEYEMKEDIKDICVSKVSNKVAVMLQKSIMLLNVVKEEEEPMKGKHKSGIAELMEVLLPRETIQGIIHPEIVQKIVDGNVELEEIEDIATTANTDRISSARSRSNQAVAKYFTPDGFRVLHLHMKAQVLDTVQQDVMYTPKPGEIITRNYSDKDCKVVSENVEIPDVVRGGASSQRLTMKEELLKPFLKEGISSNTITLRHGDRIVNENNKIKFRVTNEAEGQIQVAVVPSVITVYAVEDLKLRKLQRMTIFQEDILDVSNLYIATSKTNSMGNFVKVYELSTGKSLAVHDMPYACQCAKFSLNQQYLFAVDRSPTVKQLQGPSFTGVLRKFSLMDQELSAAFMVKEIVLFENNEHSVLVCYGPEGPDVFVRSRYIFYDFISNKRSKEMNVSRKFEDVSSDGKFGVDTSLTVYVLGTGDILSQVSTNQQRIDFDGVVERRIRYADVSMANERRARISEDNKYLVYIDGSEGTLHVVAIGVDRLKPLASCYIHAQDILSDKGFSLRHQGTVVLLQTERNIIPIALTQARLHSYSYESEYARSLSIVASVARKHTGKVEKVKVPSMFEQKKLFMQQEDIVKQKEASKSYDKLKSIPTMLIVGEPILCSSIFNYGRFSPNIFTEKMSVQNVDDAYVKLNADSTTYDAMILQLITEDVAMYGVPECVKKVSVIVEMAHQKAKIVILSFAPLRGDSKELSDKIIEVNEKLAAMYTPPSGGKTLLHLCKNSNLSEGGKPVTKYFTDGVQLSQLGLKKICENYKVTLAPLLGLHHI